MSWPFPFCRPDTLTHLKLFGPQAAGGVVRHDLVGGVGAVGGVGLLQAALAQRGVWRRPAVARLLHRDGRAGRAVQRHGVVIAAAAVVGAQRS